MNAVESFGRAITYLELLVVQDEARHGAVVIALPPKTWFSLMHAVAHRSIEVSEASDYGGITVRFPPPAGKSHDNGFWFRGAWIERSAAQ